MNPNKLLVAAILLMLLVSLSLAKSRKRLTAGSWGGQHIRIEFESAQATIDYDCAHGTIKGPFYLDSNGRFSWRGTFSREHPGPIREDEVGNSSAATYAGSVKGDKMTLTVSLTNQKEQTQTFTLTRGGGGRVFKCK
jgi:hypothetical protein